MISFRRNKEYHFYQKVISLFLSVMILNICILVPVSTPKISLNSIGNGIPSEDYHTRFFIEALTSAIFSIEGMAQRNSGSSTLLEELVENFRDWMHGNSFNWKIICGFSSLSKKDIDFLFRSVFLDSPTSPPPEYSV